MMAREGEDFLATLAGVVGTRNLLTEAVDTSAYLVEPRQKFTGATRAVVRPGGTDEVSGVLALCQAHGVGVVAQGGNTGLVGGQIPHPHGREILLSLTRLDRIRETDPLSNSMTVEAGVTLARAQAEAERVDRLFPLSLASEGSATIGGNLATNAGGTAVLAYGNARDLVLGLEVVLADGRVLRNLNKLRKDNTGYDLRHLFIGSEGTLGVITAAVLKLLPRPRSRSTAFVGVSSPDAALQLLGLSQGQGHVTSFELLPRLGLELVLSHAGGRDPLDTPHPWYVLVEFSSGTLDGAEAVLLPVLEQGFATGLIDDAAVAASGHQRTAFWSLRENLSEVQGREGGSIKHDISVPLAEIPSFMAEAEAAVTAAMPGVRIVAFGHLGDGNLHYNLSQPVDADKAAFLARWEEMNAIVHAIVVAHGGSISAEHGIGQLKRDLLPTVKDPVALDVMHMLKRAFDPAGILNPGKVLQLDGSEELTFGRPSAH